MQKQYPWIRFKTLEDITVIISYKYRVVMKHVKLIKKLKKKTNKQMLLLKQKNAKA